MKSYRARLRRLLLSMNMDFMRRFPALLRGCLCLCIASCQISCATLPQQTYLTSASLSGISKVAIVVSVNAPEVLYAKDTTSGYTGVGLLFGPLGILIEIGAVATVAAVKSGIDQGHAAEVKEHMNISHFEDKTAQSFMQPLKKGYLFQSVEQMPSMNQDSGQLHTIGYDAVIRLNVREISIQRAPGDYVKLIAYVHGEMERLATGSIVWDREEVVTNPEPHTLDYYKENGLKELDTMLEKAAKNLAYDFIYLK